MKKYSIRDATLDDFNIIKKLNDDFETFTSPIDLARIENLHNRSTYHRVIEHQSQEATNSNLQVVGFLLTLPPATDYSSQNYQWFDRRYKNFLYVDRIIIDGSLQGVGLGRKLYEDLFKYAKEHKIGYICCEYNIVPANPKSANFHRSFGFQQVGTLSDDNLSKVVSMQIAKSM
jgi:hypothetical protein